MAEEENLASGAKSCHAGPVDHVQHRAVPVAVRTLDDQDGRRTDSPERGPSTAYDPGIPSAETRAPRFRFNLRSLMVGMSFICFAVPVAKFATGLAPFVVLYGIAIVRTSEIEHRRQKARKRWKSGLKMYVLMPLLRT